jgi:hypothetical protein
MAVESRSKRRQIAAAFGERDAHHRRSSSPSTKSMTRYGNPFSSRGQRSTAWTFTMFLFESCFSEAISRSVRCSNRARSTSFIEPRLS